MDDVVHSPGSPNSNFYRHFAFYHRMLSWKAQRQHCCQLDLPHSHGLSMECHLLCPVQRRRTPPPSHPFHLASNHRHLTRCQCYTTPSGSFAVFQDHRRSHRLIIKQRTFLPLETISSIEPSLCRLLGQFSGVCCINEVDASV